MKMLLTAFALIMAAESQAGMISKRFSYIHHGTNERIELTKVNQETQTGKYYDQKSGKYKTVNLSEISQEIASVSGVKERDMVIVKFSDDSSRPCDVFSLYTNGQAHVGCQFYKINHRTMFESAPLSIVTVAADSVVKEVQALEGFAKKDKVRLMKDSGDLKKGDLVRIEHIFANGSAMIQKMGTNLLDSSNLLMREFVQVVELKDLAFN